MSIVDAVESYRTNEPYFDRESYVEWLKSFTIDERVSDDRRLTYDNLIKRLWLIHFVPSVGNDIDRAVDGTELRKRYYDILAKNTGVYVRDVEDDLGEIFGPCRVLEMLIALSMRMYDLMQDLGVYNSVSRWFWAIMENVNFDILDDDYWESDVVGYDPDDYVEETCNHIMNHDGIRSEGLEGGWFWVPGWEKMEIWYQMHAYLRQFFEK